tara:strand:- start:678 stop:1139 length:462 start_codon:yes stop_codon:yes gene_type:complete
MGFLTNVFYAGITFFLPFFGQLMMRMYYRNLWDYMIFWIPIFWMPPFSTLPALFALFGLFRRRKPMTTTQKLLMGFFAIVILGIIGIICYYIWQNFFGPEGQELLAQQLDNAARGVRGQPRMQPGMPPPPNIGNPGDASYGQAGGFDSTSPFY